MICGKDIEPSAGDLCLVREGDNVIIAPYKKKDECVAVIIEVVRVVKKLN